MSRIGKKPVMLPEGVTVTIDGQTVTVKGPKGELTREFHKDMKITQEDNSIVVARPSDSKFHKTFHGTTRSLLNGMVIGVSEGYKKELVIKGVGYRAQLQGTKLVLSAGYSHPVEMEIPKGITLEVPKPLSIIVLGINKELVGEFAANIRAVRKPEPYLGKGIRYVDEYVRRKEGKRA
ncbi:50S ribosomal protein L6 [Mycoplasmatota bacterium]|nr:50S ribosomal protein L6 [Mycoplasmatota bacterium]